MRLNHGIDQDGDPADCFDYHNDGATCPVFTVNGREIILLRTWRAALEGLRNPYLRDLAAIEPDAEKPGTNKQLVEVHYKRVDGAATLKQGE